MTKSGVEYNLKLSPYIYNFEGYDLYFSSMNHLNKFKEEVCDYIVDINKSLSNRFNFETQLVFLPVLAFYIKVESRGFYIKKDGREVEWQDITVSDGGKKIEKDFLRRFSNSIPK